MSDKCKKGRSEAECCGGCHGNHENMDVSSLGPEAVELARLFDEINTSLVSALEARRRVLEIVQRKSSESAEMKEKINRVLDSRHPVLIQFVFGGGSKE